MAPGNSGAAARRYTKPRKLVRWDNEKREIAMLHLIQEAQGRGLDLNWEYAAQQVDAECTGDALKQQLNKRREKLIAEGALIAPLKFCSSKKSRPVRNNKFSHQQSQDITDQTVSNAAGEGNTQPTGSTSLATMANLQTPKRPRSNSSDDMFDDNNDAINKESDDDYVSDWATGKPAKKKAKRGQASKSLVVTLKNPKKSQSAGASGMTPTTLSGILPIRVQSEKEAAAPANKVEGTGAILSNTSAMTSYVPGANQALHAFNPVSSHMMSAVPSQQCGNFGMLTAPTHPTNYSAFMQHYGTTTSNNMATGGYHDGNASIGQAFDTANTQYGNYSLNSGTLAGYVNGVGFEQGGQVATPALPPSSGTVQDSLTISPSALYKVNGGILPVPKLPGAGRTPKVISDLSNIHVRLLAHIPASQNSNLPGMDDMLSGVSATPIPNVGKPTNLFSAGTQEDANQLQEWDFPNAHISAPTFVAFPAGRQEDHGVFTNNEAVIAPTTPMPMPISMTAAANMYETPSPTDTSVISPQNLSFVTPTRNNGEYVAVETPMTPQRDVPYGNDVFENLENLAQSPEGDAPYSSMLGLDGTDNVAHEEFDFGPNFGF